MIQTTTSPLEIVQFQLESMISLVEKAVQCAVLSFVESDTAMADMVLEGDKAINSFEIDIDNSTYNIFSFTTCGLMPDRLRQLISIQKINPMLERIGDHAANIAEAVISLAGCRSLQNRHTIDDMALKCISILHDAVICFITGNEDLAKEVLERDDDIDNHCRTIIEEVKNVLLSASPELTFDAGLSLIRICKDLERIADLSMNIAEEAVFEIDRAEFAPSEPSLVEMTQKAIDLLSRNHRGFFLMVEGSQVDWAGHNNDPVYMVKDFLAFDDAVRAAVEFAKTDGQTAVLAFPDHNTGGMSIGHYYSDRRTAYDRTPVEALVTPLKGMKISSVGVANKIYNKNDRAEIISAVQTWWGMTLTDADVTEILSWPLTTAFNYRLASVVCKNYTTIGWTTYGHNGDDVPLWTYNCDLRGTIENTEIAEKIFDLFGVGSEWLNRELFMDADSVFPGVWTLDKTDAANPVFIVSMDGLTFRMPINKDELRYVQPASGRFPEKEVKMPLRGLVVHAPKTNRVYLPGDAVRHIHMVTRMF